MSTYEIIINVDGVSVIKRNDDDGKVWFIPADPANTDYQEYLRSL